MALAHRIVLSGLIAGALGITMLGCSGKSTTTAPSIASTTASSASFTPAQAPVDSTLYIFGSGFTGTTAVTLGGVAVEFTVSSDSQIDVFVPANAISGPIKVTNSVGSSTSSTSFYIVPTINSFTSTTDPTAGQTMKSGDTVTITGSGFIGATAPLVFYGPASSPASTSQPTYTVVSANQITTTVPAGIPAGAGYVFTLTVPGPNGGSINNNPPDNILPNPTFTIQ